MTREEFHAPAERMFYICSGGRLYIFDLVPYGYSYPNLSFRSISKDFLGTYSGNFVKGKKAGPPLPPFVDGQIRQFGNRAFICNYNLLILEQEALDTDSLEEGVHYFKFQLKDPNLFKDVFPAPDQSHYFIATETQLVRTDYNFTCDTLLFEQQDKEHAIALITQNPFYLMFTAGSKLFQYNYVTGQIRHLVTLDEPILDGFYDNQQTYLVTKKGLYRFRASDKNVKLADIPNAHTITMASSSELIISSDNGLYHYNMVNQILSLLIKGEEFNR